MLAGELYQLNKNSTLNSPKNLRPIKKIFYNDNKVTIDEKNLEEYGSETKQNTEQLQRWLQMPLNNIDVEDLNLPDFGTSPASPKPYIEVYGRLKTDSTSKSKLTLEIGKNSEKIIHTLDLSDGKIQSDLAEKTNLKLNRKDYFIRSGTLFSEYVSSGIIDKEGCLNIEKYGKIIQAFFELAQEREYDGSKNKTIPFRLYILPDDSPIKYMPKTKDSESEMSPFKDYFGNSVTGFSATATQSSKFLSFDDQAFTINCMTKENFYKNLGVGKESLEKVYVDQSQTFTISRLSWTFTNIQNSNYKFVDTKKGIVTQIYENYKVLSKDKGPSEMAYLKVICMKINQAKQEILIDENLTMKKMERMFSGINDVPAHCFEVLIDDSGQNPIWNMYLYAVRNFLAGNKVPKNYMLSYFNKILRQNQHEWIKPGNKYKIESFFSRTHFCLQLLLSSGMSLNDMQKENEGFAERVGQIARAYTEFKQNNSETDNSMSDILTYSKYDREKLRFIVSRIGRGVNLSKIEEHKKKKVTEKISSLQPRTEIADEDASKDYSYFFFKGYYYNGSEASA